MNRAVSCILLLPTLPLAAAERMIEKQVVVDVPVATAFRSWSTSEGLQAFFAPEAIVEPRPDGAYAIHFNPYAPAGLKGADGMTVMAIQLDRMVTFTWNAPPSFPEVRGQKTLVIVRTEPAGDGKTRVTLAHVGWGTGGQWDAVFDYFNNAWGRVLASYEGSVKTGPVDWKPTLEKLKAAASTPKG